MKMNKIEQQYIKGLEKMGPEKRLEIAMELGDLILDISKESIRNKYKNPDSKFVKQELKKRIRLKEELEKSWVRKKPL